MIKDDIITVIVLVSIYVVLVTIFFMFFVSMRVCFSNDIPKTTTDLSPENLKTGDILGVGYRHAFGWFATAWSKSIWSHTGIVWRDPSDNQPYVIEAATYDGCYKGVFKMPLSLWVKANRKSYIGLSRLNGTLDPSKLNEAFEERRKYVELDTYSYKWYRLLLKSPYKIETRKEFTCYELSVTLLQDSGIFQKKYSCSSYFPKDIMKAKVECEKGYSYDKVTLLDVGNYHDLRVCEGSN